jgi:hypothetical protein
LINRLALKIVVGAREHFDRLSASHFDPSTRSGHRKLSASQGTPKKVLGDFTFLHIPLNFSVHLLIANQALYVADCTAMEFNSSVKGNSFRSSVEYLLKANLSIFSSCGASIQYLIALLRTNWVVRIALSMALY